MEVNDRIEPKGIIIQAQSPPVLEGIISVGDSGL